MFYYYLHVEENQNRSGKSFWYYYIQFQQKNTFTKPCVNLSDVNYYICLYNYYKRNKSSDCKKEMDCFDEGINKGLGKIVI